MKKNIEETKLSRMTRPNDYYHGELRSKYNHETMHKSKKYKTFKGAHNWAKRTKPEVKFGNEMYVHVLVVVEE